MNLKKHLPFLIRVKVYIDRARAYYAYGQLFALVAIGLKVFGVHFTKLDIALGLPVLLLFSAILGWLDMRFGFFQEEAKRHSNLNPVYQDMLERLERIEQQGKRGCLINEYLTETAEIDAAAFEAIKIRSSVPKMENIPHPPRKKKK